VVLVPLKICTTLRFPEDVYKETTMPVIEHYNKLDKVAEIDSGPSVDEVYEKSANVIRELLAGKLDGNVTA
jgi:UMP-CMP kinase